LVYIAKVFKKIGKQKSETVYIFQLHVGFRLQNSCRII